MIRFSLVKYRGVALRSRVFDTGSCWIITFRWSCWKAVKNEVPAEVLRLEDRHLVLEERVDRVGHVGRGRVAELVHLEEPLLGVGRFQLGDEPTDHVEVALGAGDEERVGPVVDRDLQADEGRARRDRAVHRDERPRLERVGLPAAERRRVRRRARQPPCVWPRKS